jgi:DNA ligase-1
MRRLADLYATLDRSTATSDKRAALVAYFRDAPARDAAWGLHLLRGGKLARIAGSGELREWIAEESGQPPWLVDESHAHVGDLAETLTLLLPDPDETECLDLPLSSWVEQRLLPVAKAAPDIRRAAVVEGWRRLPEAQRLLFNKLLTGALRVGVSQGLVQQALAELAGIDIARIAQRLMGAWAPTAASFMALLDPAVSANDRAQPFPFYLASPLEAEPATLGESADWQLEWKWDGIRLQLIRRDGTVALWSRGEERLDGRFPEIERAAIALPEGTVLDGELLAWGNDAPRPFIALQKRIARLKPGPKTLADCPVRMLAYDLLEFAGEDWRARPLHARRAQLERVVAQLDSPVIGISESVAVANWGAAATLRAQARERNVEGLMLKRRDAPYQAGRKRGDWWKWKIEPLSIDAVLLYAQSGSGRRSTLFTDYTFGLWEGERLVPVAKAYSGLDDAEILRLDRWIRQHTTERFGPVRAVEAAQVFELGFEAVNRSSRHKSGVAVRFPRILKWRSDRAPAQADRVEDLLRLAR